MKRATTMQLSVLLATMLSTIGTVQAAESPSILGWIEKVAVLNSSLVMHAKVDTGADNSSINASAIDYVTRDGRDIVRFKLKDRSGAEVVMERPLVRVSQIKRKEGGYIERPVVTMGFCVGGKMVDAEVNLADRNHFKYQMLVGRSLMARRFVVDPERTYITQPTCTAS